MRTRRLLPVLLALVAGCGLPLDTGQRVPTFPIFDPGTGEIPMPNDALRDEASGRLDLPLDDDDLSPTERAFRQWMNTRDGWSTTLPATVRFSAVVDERSIDADSVQVWDWLPTPRRVTGLEWRLEDGARRLTIAPPRTGWERGHRYVVVVRGGPLGVRDAQGFGVEPDAIFYFLRRDEVLNTIGHNRAFPGATRAERLDAGTRLENLRLELAPFFEFFEDPSRPRASEIPRDEVAALWSFTVTADPELAMDRESQRVPLPFDLLVDPDTGLVSLEEAPWDSELEVNAKRQANELDGFGVSPNLLFELTEAVDPTSVAGNVHLFELDGPRSSGIPRELPITVKVMGDNGEIACRQTPTPADCIHLVVVVDDAELPLRGQTTYAIVVDRGIRSADGREVHPMPIGWFMRSEHPIEVRGRSQIGSLTDTLARRVEGTRARIDEFLDGYGRANIITAWPFTTMDAVPAIRAASRATIDLGLDAEPTIRERLRPAEALETLSPGVAAAAVRTVYLTRSIGVREYVIGTIPSPYFLDPITRRWRDDGRHPSQPVRFYMAIPDGLDPNVPAPVVIFGHAVVTDARFLMAIAGELARRGFVSIAIDFPFHGERIACIDASLVGIPNFFPEVFRNLTGLRDDILRFPPCASGSSATCSTDGRCLTADGRPDDFNEFPLISVQMASGAAFLDTHDLPYINDHFRQALVDLSSLLRSIQTADWRGAVGVRLDPERVHYAGQSLGGIIGAVWVSVTPEIDRAVLNVPGSDMVDLFVESTYFSPQIDEYFTSIEVPRPSFEEERLLDVARWLIDSVDPHSVAHLYAEEDRDVLIQMCRGDIVIPNRTTEVLRRVSGRPMRTYPSPLHGDLVIPAIGDQMLRDMGAFLAGAIEE